MLFLGNTNAVVAHINNRFIAFISLYADFYTRLDLFAHEFRGVIQKILYDYQQVLTVAACLRKSIFDFDTYTAFPLTTLNNFRTSWASSCIAIFMG